MKGVEKNGNLATRDGGSNKVGDSKKKRFNGRGGEESRKENVTRGGKKVDSGRSFAEILKQG